MSWPVAQQWGTNWWTLNAALTYFFTSNTLLTQGCNYVGVKAAQCPLLNSLLLLLLKLYCFNVNLKDKEGFPVS